MTAIATHPVTSERSHIASFHFKITECGKQEL